MKQPTIYDNLTNKLGRKPTHQEIRDEVKRILNEALIDRAEAEKLSNQRKGKLKRLLSIGYKMDG